MTAPSRSEEERDFILAILYEPEIQEEERTRMIAAHHAQISADDYLGVWCLLDSKARSAWKKYLDEAKVMRLEGKL